MEPWQAKRNKLIKKIANVSRYHNRGIYGQGVKELVGEFDPKGHHAGMVGVLPKEFAPGLYSEYFDVDPNKSNSSFIKMLEYAIDNDFDIISTSFRIQMFGNYEQKAKELIKTCEDKGIVIVNSIGNTGNGDVGDNALLSPYIINVGAVDIKGGQPIRESYSSIHEAIDCMGIIGWYDNEYGYVTGTSGARPYVSSLLALYICENGRVHPDEFIKACSMDIYKLGFDKETGHGLIALPNHNKWSIKFVENFVHRWHTVQAFKKGYRLS